MTLVILLALIANICYAGNDLSGAMGARKMSPYLMSFMGWVMGAVLYSIAALFLFHGELLILPIVVTFILAALMVGAYPLFLTSVQKGNATVNGVIGGTFPLWVVFFSVIFYNERLTPAEIITIIIIMAGVILSALHLTRRTRIHDMLNRYSLMAFGVSIIWGITFTFLRYPVDTLGWFEAGFMQTIFGALLSIIWLYPKVKHDLRSSFKKFYAYPAVNALTGFTATTAYTYALTKGESSIVAPIAGSYSALYAVLSYLVFKERLTRLQVFGIVLTIIGVGCLSYLVSR